jgi:hypothetical protein
LMMLHNEITHEFTPDSFIGLERSRLKNCNDVITVSNRRIFRGRVECPW